MASPSPARPGRPPIVCHGHARPIVDVNWSVVTPDGYFLASASKDGQPMLRHGETGDWYGTFQGHKGAVWSCVLNQPALLAATGSADFTAKIWDACTGNELHSFQHNHIVRCTAFAHGSNRLATGGMEKLIRIYDLEKPTEAPEQLAPQPASIRCLAWLHDDNLLLCSYTDKNGISVIDTRSKQQVQTIETDAPVSSIEISYDGQYMTTAEGRVVRMFHTSGLRQFKQHKLTGAANAESASYCAARNLFVAGGEDMWVRVFNADSGAELECNKGHHGPVHAVRFAPTYESYASGSEDGTIRIYAVDGNSNGPATTAH
mmetsp:Transcript_32652/g.82857  ORF Transcript_32652/g.82857 Transcript_32652/m.82857 type:complete len:317 (-) Transcript_32652:475-1425(-)